jgi:riboflavin kinase/FMN adenylyltransferase
VWITSSLDTVLTPTVIALGNFDGLHRGHQQVIQPILKQPSPLDSRQRTEMLLTNPVTLLTWDRGVLENPVGESPPFYSTVVTFHPHPQEFFTGQPKKLLTPLDEKVEWLKIMGVEQLVLLPFDEHMATLTPRDFVEKILIQKLQPSCISVGFDFRFGTKRTGTVKDLEKIAAHHGIKVKTVPLFLCENGERISSSEIRTALENGAIRRANQLLGRPYHLVGSVVHGKQLGRTIGFPTANLHLPPEKFLPRYGVYAVKVSETEIKSRSETGSDANLELVNHPGVMNIGCRPTVAGQTVTIEVHLLDWSGDLYGKTLKINLEEFLRPEQKFPSLESLKTQIQADCLHATKVLTVGTSDS